MLGNLKDNNPLLILAGIILIPIAVAAVSLWVDTRIDERQRRAAEDLFQRQQRLVVAQTIDAYFQGVGTVLMHDDDLSNRMVIARTNALLRRLEQPRDRALVLNFLSEVRPALTRRPARMLERASQPFVDLAGLDLGGADLSFVNLYRANLRGARFNGASLRWANLTGANLRGAELDGADLRGARLSEANLADASLRGALTGGADFSSADLRGADLSRADTSDYEFEGLTTSINMTAALLSGARWIDGASCAEGSIGRCVQP